MEIKIMNDPSNDVPVSEEGSALVKELASEIIELINRKAGIAKPDNVLETPINLAINVLIGALFAVVQHRLQPEHQKDFIMLIAEGLAKNFKYFNQWVKEDGHTDNVP